MNGEVFRTRWFDSPFSKVSDYSITLRVLKADSVAEWMVRVSYDIIDEKPLLAFLGGSDFIVIQNNFFVQFFAKKRVQITCYKRIE
jgi:hypothetical protein